MVWGYGGRSGGVGVVGGADMGCGRAGERSCFGRVFYAEWCGGYEVVGVPNVWLWG